MKLKYQFDKAIQLSLVSDNEGAKKIADEVIEKLEKGVPYTEIELYSQDITAQMYELYYNFEPDRKWLDKALEIRKQMKVDNFNSSGKAKYFSDIAYVNWKLGNYEVAEQHFTTSLGYEENAFAQIYLLDCLVEQNKIKNLKEYLENVEFNTLGVDCIDFLIILGNAGLSCFFHITYILLATNLLTHCIFINNQTRQPVIWFRVFQIHWIHRYWQPF